MKEEISGIHHVTAIASDPQQNVNFYAGVLGLRLVKKTVNFDDPGTYHFYYGDEHGAPGTILTFFPWRGVQRGRQGTGQATTTSFSVPEESFGYWVERLTKHGVEYDKPARRFDEQVLGFRDPDGLALELVAHAGEKRDGWEQGSVPAEHAIRGFHTVTLCVDSLEGTVKLLAETMGLRKIREEGNLFRYEAGDGGAGAQVDVQHTPGFWKGVVAGGTVHHVAWRTESDETQLAWQSKITEAGLSVTPVLDREYFHSIYFREPGGILFEIATDPPGFAVDEPVESLGSSLKLPPWLEASRQKIEGVLVPVHLPETKSEAASAATQGNYARQRATSDER